MNIFVLDEDKQKCAEYHCDKHVVKMIIEYAQMLSTTVRLTTDNDIGYRITHKNHPCTVWVRESLSNWLWLRDMTKFLNDEYRKRYNKDVNHKSFDVIKSLPLPNIPDLGLTKFKLAMPEHCKTESVIESYRKYYMIEKKDFVTWKNMDKPKWFKN
jgi:hypothetical protein